ncbi:dimethylallyltranstransferase / geranyltranstransferase [Natronorubrum sp. JWXQ-INN-674]|uniref:Dimethylallyltranstransferase / geranyltranstransferase n=1 Tax=Natronorubrum halalkaliphilum TaxID=2691917 RepID=A0A6B0VG75_9EURY|nr:dimethylallyltranstransferase / geranyltranstransferase [Natronorubrum halalkaliphilum]MXV60504.1 dimethylallyltranstransferase / geranyltranstransferase [Natronorubrum halalkaliphilum]
MRETIIQRRTEIEDAIRSRLPEADEFDRYREAPLSIGRPRTRGQVFLALVDGCTAGHRALDSDRNRGRGQSRDHDQEQVLPIAAALELASLQTDVHRTAFDHSSSGPPDYDPTRDILRGDLLESTAFETMLSVCGPPRMVQRYFAILVRANRRVQEGHATGYEADAASTADLDAVRQLGALTGGAAELAALVAEIESDDRQRLIDHGTALGFHVSAHLNSGAAPTETRSSSKSIDACHRHIDALADCCPSQSRDRVRRQLRAFLEVATNYESVESVV